MFDVVTARAVARLPILAEYLLPFVKIGGACIAMKGPGAEEEIKEAKKAIQVLGGEVKEVKHLLLPVGMGARYLIWIEKQKRTPKRYPRKAGVPSKQPIS
jgi:16S rRNA (guanine527-N7)-methyltransferase